MSDDDMMGLGADVPLEEVDAEDETVEEDDMPDTGEDVEAEAF